MPIPARRAERAARASAPKSAKNHAPGRGRAKGPDAARRGKSSQKTGARNRLAPRGEASFAQGKKAARAREIGWGAFGEIVRDLAARIRERYRPQVVVGIARGGVFVGAALSTALGADFYPIRIEKRRRDAGQLPHAIVELPNLGRRRVLVVDDVAASGATLAKTRAFAKKSGAGEVKTAVLVARPGARPDFSAMETEDLVVFGWDYQLDAGTGTSGPVDPGEVGV